MVLEILSVELYSQLTIKLIGVEENEIYSHNHLTIRCF